MVQDPENAAAQEPSGSSALDRFFHLSERGTTVATECLGGATTFLTMAYIIVVNPAILSFAGMPQGPATVATALSAVFGTLLMALYANRPIAVAPYMGENAFIAFGLAAMGIGWQKCLGAVFVSGLAFFLLSLVGVRQWLANSISAGMKHSIAAGIGLFIAFVGCYQTGIVTSSVAGMPPSALILPQATLLRNPDVPLKCGNLHDPQVLLALFGFLLMAGLMARKVKGAIFIGIFATAIVGYLCGFGELPKGIIAMPFTGNFDLSPLAFKLDIPAVLQLSFLPVLITLFLMSFLDTIGTLVGVGATGNLLDEKGNFPDIERPMIVDSLSCMFSAVAGSSTSGAFLESAAGVKEGARTGLASVVTAALFAASMFFIPLIEPLQHLRFAYAPALIAIGLLMVGSISKVDFDDMSEAVPAFTTIALILFTYNIANGITAGLVLYPLSKLAAGRRHEINSGSIVLCLLCLSYFVFGVVH